MREKSTKIKKSIFRIVICSIGGVIAIFGLMFVISLLFKIPDDISKYLLYFFGIVLILCVGLSLYFLSIKPLCYFAKSRHFVKSCKMSREEKFIHNIKIYMKQRKSRIAGISFFLISMVSTLILMTSLGKKLTETMTTEHIELLNLAKLMLFQWHFALATGFIIALLILEIGNVTKDKHMLTVNMWERIQELESEVKELKGKGLLEGEQEQKESSN